MVSDKKDLDMKKEGTKIDVQELIRNEAAAPPVVQSLLTDEVREKGYIVEENEEDKD